MKKELLVAFVLMLSWSILNGQKRSISPNLQTTYFKEDTTSLLRNPAMGWGVYDDANTEVQNAEEYWKAQDAAARKYASFFYVRYRWSDMEPEEGKYAWLYNENYKKLIAGAKQRGLKLCFRVYNHSQDNLRQSTPEYVRQAGAKGYIAKGSEGQDLWTPYPDNNVYQEKMAKFIEAFAKEYDNPDIVDFIDGYSVGFWGECHNIRLQNPGGLESVLSWYARTYSSNFKNVLLLLPFGSQVGFEAENRLAIKPYGYGMRRDGLGSMWFSDNEMDITNQMYGRTLLVGESCWWQGYTDDFRPFATDTRYKLNTWRDVYELTYKQAIENHFNTLDLREIPETKGWTTRAPDLVQQFVVKGGYRFYPVSVSVPKVLTTGNKVTVFHTWKNTGNGYLPNNLPNWDYKYKPSLALLDKKGNVVAQWTDNKAEPSSWLTGAEHTYPFEINIENIPPGEYQWAVAITDRKRDNQPGIKLAVQGKELVNGWSLIGKSVNIK